MCLRPREVCRLQPWNRAPATPLMVEGSWSLKVWRGRAAGERFQWNSPHVCPTVEVLLELMNAGELALGALPQSDAPALRGWR